MNSGSYASQTEYITNVNTLLIKLANNFLAAQPALA